MSKFAFLISCLLLSAPLALAKDKLAFQWNCGSPLEKHTIDVGDRANHSYSISKIACSPGKSSLREKSGLATRFEDSAETFDNWHGILVATTENGDKIYYSYASKGDAVRKEGKFQSGAETWSIVGGTGMFAGARGKGTCIGQRNSDGTVTWDCQGTYGVTK